MLTLLKTLSGTFLSGHPRLEPLDLDRDFPDVERLFVAEQWPFLRSDLELSHAQPRAASFVARKDGRFAGFFMTHAFGDVGYLDMMIVPSEFRRAGIARPLYFHTVKALRATGVRGLVVHTTRDSARMMPLLGFRSGPAFTLLRREQGSEEEPAGRLGAPDRDAILALDAAAFGLRREPWIDALLAQDDARFVGVRRRGRLDAVACLRPRRHGTRALDLVSAIDDDALDALVHTVLRATAAPLECFARVGSRLEGRLLEARFAVPAFFHDIGPLVEWRCGRTEDLGKGASCLTWF
jgi:ribosomal protein S18 acetylase RimI-like enzyme